MDYTNGAMTEFDYYNSENGWYYTDGDSLWGTSGPFHGAYHSSSGLGLTKVNGHGLGIYTTVKVTGTVTPYFDVFNSNMGDLYFAIAVNGHVVWPHDAAWQNLDDQSGWYHAYNGDAEGETATTAAILNEALSSCVLNVEEGDVVTFLFERDNRTAFRLGQHPIHTSPSRMLLSRIVALRG